MASAFKRLFGHDKAKRGGPFALCIGDFSLAGQDLTGSPPEVLQKLLLRDVAEDQSSSTGLPSPVPRTHRPTSSSLKAFRSLLQNLSPKHEQQQQPDDDLEGQRCVGSFLKAQLGATDIVYVTAGEEGVIWRDRVLTKLTKYFKHATVPVVVVVYSGASDERGNWRLAASSAPGASPSGGGGSASSSSSVVSFREVSMLWQRLRKHSQRLVLLLDCANSGYWVSSLRMLSKAEQLELSIGIQASDCCGGGAGATPDEGQLNYRPGLFLHCYMTSNRHRAEPRRSAMGNGAMSNGGGAPVGLPRDGWLPGMQPSFYCTWLTDSLVDYGVALKFFGALSAAPAAGGPRGTVFTPAEAPYSTDGAGSRQLLGIIASAKANRRPSHLAADITSPCSKLWEGDNDQQDPGVRGASAITARRRLSAYAVDMVHMGTSLKDERSSKPSFSQVHMSSPQEMFGPLSSPRGRTTCGTLGMASGPAPGHGHGPPSSHGVLNGADGGSEPPPHLLGLRGAHAARVRTLTQAAAAGSSGGCSGPMSGGSSAPMAVGGVEHSAASDTAAMHWDRRNVQAAEAEEEDELGAARHAASTSFTGQGFTTELFGALQEVAQLERLRGRRAPLEGCEGLDSMMQDVDLADARMSNVSLPSQLLPRSMTATGPAGEPPVNQVDLLLTQENVRQPGLPSAGPSRFLLTSNLDLMQSPRLEMMDGLEEVLKRVRAVATSTAGCSGPGTGLPSATGDEGASSAAPSPLHSAHGVPSSGLMSTVTAELLAMAHNYSTGGGLPAGSPMGGASPRLSRGGSRAVGTPSSSSMMLRQLLRQQVSIADSEDWDMSPSAGQGQRRAGRFEVGGSERSSFLFNDDSERFEVLKALRQQHGDDFTACGSGGSPSTDSSRPLSYTAADQHQHQQQQRTPSGRADEHVMSVAAAAAADAEAGPMFHLSMISTGGAEFHG